MQKGVSYIRTRNYSVIYKILTALALFTGIILNLSKTDSIISLLSYFTFQSNIVCFIAFVCFVVLEIQEKNGKYQKGDIYCLIKGATVIIICITALCYHIALVPQFGFQTGLKHTTNMYNKIANFFVHTYSPIMVVLDYFLFDEKGRFKKYYPFIWLFFPYSYVLFVYIYAGNGGTFYGIGGSKKFAYFFLDYIELGIPRVIMWIIIMSLGILIVSYLLIWIDKLFEKKKRS